jgi:hypothetical protein
LFNVHRGFEIFYFHFETKVNISFCHLPLEKETISECPAKNTIFESANSTCWVIVLFELLIMPLKNSISVIKIDEFHSCGNQELPTQQEKNYAAHVENMKGTG